MASGDITDNLTGDPLTTSTTTESDSSNPLTPPTVSLDQADLDYFPGETVGITATDLGDGGSLSFLVAHRAAGADEILVSFDEPQRAVTPGQAAVFYDGEVVVGGGWIV